MSDLLKSIDAKTKLAGTNKLEMLTFSLGVNSETGRSETFGINVFKVREVIKTPAITAAPGMNPAVKGMVSLRGNIIPVVDLAEFCGRTPTDHLPPILILTEYNGKTQGFLVDSVDTILRVDWNDMKAPPAMLAGSMKGLVTAVTEVSKADGPGILIMMLDVERVLGELAPAELDELPFKSIEPLANPQGIVFYADDSGLARKQIEKTLTALGIRSQCAHNGAAAWAALSSLADTAVAAGKEVREILKLVLTDIEMPEMDGFALTKKIKTDPRFSGIPVLMHSSLSGTQNQELGKSVGVNGYVSKFDPKRLAECIREHVIQMP